MPLLNEEYLNQLNEE